MNNVIQRVLNKDPAAALDAKQAGPGINPDLLPLVHHSDAKVRRIALYCLDETGGPVATKAFLEAVLDEDSQVRSAALKGLHDHPPAGSRMELLRAYDRSPDGYVRQQLMLVAARASGGMDVNEIKTRYTHETDPQAREGALVALAKSNDQESRKEFVVRLHETSGKDRVRFLEYCQILQAPWLLKPLLPLLNDKDPAIRVGTDARPDLIDTLRVCDLTVNLVALISGRKFSFPINRATNYQPQQIDEVREFVRNSP